MNSALFFTRRKVVFGVASLCCLFWGSAYPAIKNGYALFNIAADDIPSKLVFAGYRFLFAGLLSFDFTLLGEGFIVMAAFVLSAASIYGKKVS